MASSSVTMASSSVTVPSSSSNPLWKYDVFLSFCGVDTRRTFVSHLYRELDRLGVSTFKDDEKIERGTYITDGLIQAIRGSKSAIVIISENYAFSSFCLQELSEIVDSREKGSLELLIPIFYDVDPSDVRKQRGNFAVASNQKYKKESSETRERWKQALITVAKIAGEDSRNWTDDSALIQKISREIFNLLNSILPSDFSDLVGMEAHMKEMESLLSLGSDNEVRIIGISGMGGIGKTTLARYIYQKFSYQFDASCFIYNVKGIPGSHDPENLQKYFLSKILGRTDLGLIGSVHGSNIIKQRLGHLKVLAVIDNIDKQGQFDALAGDTNWFGRGSRIILTTRERDLLPKSRVYKIKHLNDNDAIKLFNQYAFEQGDSKESFLDLSIRVVEYARGLPLALTVWGKFLRKMKKEEWEIALSELEGRLHGEIMEKLRVSSDKLDEKTKSLFLYISCFFDWTPVDRMTRLLKDTYQNAEFWLKFLVNKSLVEVSPSGEIRVHDLLQQMAKDIVQDCSIHQPGKCRFLFDFAHLRDILTNATGTGKVEGIALDMCKKDGFTVTDQAFKKMRNLKILNIYGIYDQSCTVQAEGLNHLPHKLVSIQWERYPLRTLPPRYSPQDLVELLMPYSKLDRLWEGNLPLRHLKVVNLSASQHLKAIPDLSMAPNVEELDLSECDSLVEVSSIQSLQKLLYLSLGGCGMLKTFPSCHNMELLKHLDLNGCFNLTMFPEVPSGITTLQLRHTAIEEVPSSIKDLSSLVSLDMSYCKKISGIPCEIENLSELKTLNLGNCDSLADIPTTIQNMKSLKTLCLSHCKQLQSLPQLPKSLKYLVAHGCSSLARITQLPSAPAQHLVLSDCVELAASEDLQQMISNQCGDMECPFVALLPGHQIPECFELREMRSSLTMTEPQKCHLKGFLACIVIASEAHYDPMALFVRYECSLRQYCGTVNLLSPSWHELYQVCRGSLFDGEHLFLFGCYFEKPVEYTEMVFEFCPEPIQNIAPFPKIKACAVHPILAEDLDKRERDRSTAPSGSFHYPMKQVKKPALGNPLPESLKTPQPMKQVKKPAGDQLPESLKMPQRYNEASHVASSSFNNVEGRQPAVRTLKQPSGTSTRPCDGKQDNPVRPRFRSIHEFLCYRPRYRT